MKITYQRGFGNTFSTEAEKGALPVGQNSPQETPTGLYPEVLSGSAFTAPRAENLSSWLYRMRPSAMHGPYKPIADLLLRSGPFAELEASPNRLRWNPLPIPSKPTDFLDGLVTIAGSGDPASQHGIAVHVYCANRSMKDRFFYCADGELMFVPQEGAIELATEFGRLAVAPGEVAVVPRGVKFAVELTSGTRGGAGGVRGYLCENYGAAFRLPELGPIGAQGLAQKRDFLYPVAAYEKRRGKCQLVAKFLGHLWATELGHTPLDVVAWHGNYAPYKYDLARFNTIGSISFDHPDPSIFLVLQSQSDTAGVDAIDFVIFPPRILAMEHTFRPPWFHRNIASEFMGLIEGVYDAKAAGFVPGGASLHNCMTGHGPDPETFEKASAADTSKANYVRDTMAFMFETRQVIRPTHQALESRELQRDYARVWQGLKKNFDPAKP